MESHVLRTESLGWDELEKLAPQELDRIEGPTNSYSKLRLFGNPEKSVRVILYRDHHAWCPYCQKVWLWLEFKRIPYRIQKVTMRCYGEKESWYLEKVPTGILPALEIDNQLITESDEILLALENTFGPLGRSINDTNSIELRFLERRFFRAWCMWLCRPSLAIWNETKRQNEFQVIAQELEQQLLKEKGPFLDSVADESGSHSPGSCDLIFIPYLERMNASLSYYKGFNLRKEHPGIDSWFTALEAQEEYRGTQGDFHTHSHDLPPQMGGCYFSTNSTQKQFAQAIDNGSGLGEMEMSSLTKGRDLLPDPSSLALRRVLKHRKTIMKINPLGEPLFDQPLRAALTLLINGQASQPSRNSALGLRYLRDRISVPRDMPLLAARELRKALEATAKLDSTAQGPSIKTSNRLDQNPLPFLSIKQI